MRIGDFTVPGSDMVVNGGFEYNNDSLSGNSSGTATVNKGIKPKSFTVDLTIAKENASDMTALVRVAEGIDGAGAQTIYDIVDDTINAFNVRKVMFDKQFRVVERKDLQAWDITFTLTEKASTSEKAEQRLTVATSSQKPVSAGKLPFNVDSGMTTDYEKALAITTLTINV